MSRADKRVVFVAQNYPPDKGGLPSRMHDMTTALTEEGHSVTVLAPPPSLPPEAFDRSWKWTDRERIDGVDVRRLWTWHPTSPDPEFLTRMIYYVGFALHALAWLVVHRGKYDTVVTTTPPISTGLAGVTTALTGANWVVDVRDLWIDASLSLGFITEGGLVERASRGFQRVVLQKADAISVTTEALGASLCREYGESLSEKLLHVPNGVDIDQFQQPRDPATDPYSIVYTGNIGHAQRLDICVEAMAHVSEDAVLRLVGGGDCIEELQQKVEHFELADRVELVGTVERDVVPKILSEATLGLAPIADHDELSYAMPTKVYEYMGNGLPVIAVGGGALEEFMSRSGGGVHVEHDPKAIAAAIDRLLSDQDLRRKFGQQGQQYVRDRYDRQDIAGRFGQRLDELREYGSVSTGARSSEAAGSSVSREQ